MQFLLWCTWRATICWCSTVISSCVLFSHLSVAAMYDDMLSNAAERLSLLAQCSSMPWYITWACPRPWQWRSQVGCSLCLLQKVTDIYAHITKTWTSAHLERAGLWASSWCSSVPWYVPWACPRPWQWRSQIRCSLCLLQKVTELYSHVAGLLGIWKEMAYEHCDGAHPGCRLNVNQLKYLLETRTIRVHVRWAGKILLALWWVWAPGRGWKHYTEDVLPDLVVLPRSPHLIANLKLPFLFFTRTTGDCHIDAEGCIISASCISLLAFQFLVLSGPVL